MSIEQLNDSEHKLDKLKRGSPAAAERGRLGGIAAQNGLRERRAKLAVLRARLEAKPNAEPWLVDSAVAAYAVILRGLMERQTKHGVRRPQSKDVVWATSRLEELVRQINGLPEHAPESTTSHRNRFESASLSDAPANTPAAPKQPVERVFTEAEFLALPQDQQREWLRKPRDTYEIVPNEGPQP